MIKAFVVLFIFCSAYAAVPGLWAENAVVNPKIIKGEDAREGEFPYMISLRQKASNEHVCGGSILTSNWVLTAADCCATTNEKALFINSESIYLDRGGNNHTIEKIIIHDDYSPDFYWMHDICLVRVKNPFKFSTKVTQITLPKQNWPVNPGDKLTVSGWGFHKFTPEKPTIPNKLQKATGYIALSNEDCRNQTLIPVTPNYLCARNSIKGLGVCNGDSGSPMVKNGVQVGITSWVFVPCGSGKPDFFTCVPYYVNWIKKKLGSEAGQLKFTA